MAELVTLDLTELAPETSRELVADLAQAAAEQTNTTRFGDFRQHAQGVFDGVTFDGQTGASGSLETGPKHWLLGSVYGRDVLKSCLGILRSDVTVSKWRYQPELDGLLEEVIDTLGLRDWVEPTTFRERMEYFAKISTVLLSVEKSEKLCSAV